MFVKISPRCKTFWFSFVVSPFSLLPRFWWFFYFSSRWTIFVSLRGGKKAKIAKCFAEPFFLLAVGLLNIDLDSNHTAQRNILLKILIASVETRSDQVESVWGAGNENSVKSKAVGANFKLTLESAASKPEVLLGANWTLRAGKIQDWKLCSKLGTDSRRLWTTSKPGFHFAWAFSISVA